VIAVAWFVVLLVLGLGGWAWYAWPRSEDECRVDSDGGFWDLSTWFDLF